MDKRLTGKVAVITGASSGIGEAAVLALSAEGAHIVASARRLDRLAELQRKIEMKGGDCLCIQADVQDEAQCRNLIAKAEERFHQIDILVNNAGVMLLSPIIDADTNDWRRMINTNVLGLMYCTLAVLPGMKRRKSGHIVQISSVAGRTARPNIGGYNASKWAVNGFSEALRQEVHMDGIRVTMIEPGVVRTELREHITNVAVKEDHEKWAASMTQLESEDVADAIVYAVTAPQRANINEILLRPTDQQG
jgi:NADP-dependent 3-hydroxy acid dehydrogenase YdfG